ncbi:MAG: hypothetical protein GWP62_06040 [Gammaproteobacteria bacterium]|jgi:hypothetical protein|nr:hypothetical protein [Gammaproteobacteria bacterium]
MNQDNRNTINPDFRSLLTWIASGLLIYLLVSGALVFWLPFGVYAQYSVIVHSMAGVLALLPVGIIVGLHWRRRESSIAGYPALLAKASIAILILGLGSGLAIVVQSVFGRAVADFWWLVHQWSALGFGIMLFLHLLPILIRYANTPSTPRRIARRWFLAAAAVLLVMPLALTDWLAGQVEQAEDFQAFPSNYVWRYGDDRPFWPSRARIANVPWEAQLHEGILGLFSETERESLRMSMAELQESRGGPLERFKRAAAPMALDADRQREFNDLLAAATESMQQEGALRPEPLLGSQSCGAGGCHDDIYNEWVPSAHGFAAIDPLFLDVQEALAEANGAADTRACAGCHDPVTLLSGGRDGGSIGGGHMETNEGISCLVCHSVVETDTNGNGGYVLQVPDRYLFANDGGPGKFWNHFLIRSYPEKHVETFARPLYEDSEYCAACHKQTGTSGEETPIGLAQEQNEYDSWRQGHWYHEDDPDKTISCRDCHMPLVAGTDPIAGEQHRSHRTLGSNMYVPAVLDLPGGAEQASQTIRWLRGEIDIPEIADRWADGPVVAMTIVAPDEIRSGELVNVALILHNNKTGHDFPAGPLDILSSWIELKVEDNLGRTLLHLGDPAGDKPTLDAPIVYKADWYDKRGLPVDRHNIWEVVGSSYKNALESGGVESVDIAFRCPVIARPKISDSFSEEGPGERKSDVVFSIDNESVTELTVTARLLYRKADPEFIAKTYKLESAVEVPTIELNAATHTIAVSPP